MDDSIGRAPLSPREQQVLRLRWAGHSLHVTASALRLQLKTVRNYQDRLRHKLGARSLLDACRKGLQRGYRTVNE